MQAREIAGKFASTAMSWALKVVLTLVAYSVGDRLIASILQWGEDMGLGFWGVWAIAFTPQGYSWTSLALGAFGVFPLLFCDAITPGRLHPVTLAVAAAAAGAYYQVMFFGYDVASDLERSYDGFLRGTLPSAPADVISAVCFIVLAFLPPILLTVGKLVASIGGRNGDSAVGQ